MLFLSHFEGLFQLIVAVIVVITVIVVSAVAGELHAVAADITFETAGQLDEVPGVVAAPDGCQQVGKGLVNPDLREGGAADGRPDVDAALDGHDIAHDVTAGCVGIGVCVCVGIGIDIGIRASVLGIGLYFGF